MTTLLAQRPHFPMTPAPFAHAHAQPGSSSHHASHASPRMFNQEETARAAPYASPYLTHDAGARPRTQSPLQISTTAPSAAEHEPEEETAHPSRMRTQLQHGAAESETPQQASTSTTAPEEAQRAPSSLTAAHGFGNLDEGLSRPLTLKERDLLAHLDRLKFFLATAPSRWTPEGPASATPPAGHPNSAHPALNRFLLPNAEYVSCVLWGGLYHITGTDIVRALVFRFEAFGRPVRNMKKFEEGVFSDLRNLKPGLDACLEEPKSPFLDLLFKYQCIRTQKKQKVFYWFSVPHDRLFLDALERDLKREKMGLEPTTAIAGEPALSFTYDPKRSLYDQFSKATGGVPGEGELEAAVRRADEARSDASRSASPEASDAEMSNSEAEEGGKKKSALHGPHSPFFSMFSLFEGSPTYKQRRKKVPKRASPSLLGISSSYDTPEEYYAAPVRAQEPQMDRYGRDMTRLSAADMFVAQARGDFGPQSNPDLIASQRERQRRAMLAHADAAGLPHPQQPMRASPESMYASPMVVGARPPMPEARHTFPGALWPAQEGAPKTKAYVCPLFSCGRMFARAEHLKRHLRTHTLERPYACARCKRAFARSDNLNQHLRTHARADSGEVVQEQEEEGEEGGYLESMPDVGMCEVEIAGCVQEVQGDEDGLVVPAPSLPVEEQEIFYPDATTSGLLLDPAPEYTNSPNAQWATARAHPSPAFSTVSMPSPSLSASYAPSYPEYTSLSAPSHKQTFDHSTLYPPMDGGAGPIRRHRSATPSMGIGRGAFHPYALAAHSAESSPLAYSVPLYDGPRSHSRASSAGGLQDGLGAMLLEPSAAMDGAGFYRTESPMHFQGYEQVDEGMFVGMEQQQPAVGPYMVDGGMYGGMAHHAMTM